MLINPDKITLPDFSLLEDWEIMNNEAVRFGKLDLDNFYHRLGVLEWLIPYLGLPAIRAEELGMGEGMINPACCTLPMGLSYSVLLAQLAHLHVLRKVSIAPIINMKVNENQMEWVTMEVLGLGCVFSEKKCGISPKEERIKQVVSVTRYMLALLMISSKSVEFVLGYWIWFVLLYRPLYSNFYHVYK